MKQVTPEAAFTRYLAFHNHFNTESYDYFKYNGSVRGDPESMLAKRKDRWFFKRLGAKFSDVADLELFLLANFLVKQKIHVSAMTDKALDDYREKMRNLPSTFKEDLLLILNEAGVPFSPMKVYKLLVKQEIQLETFIIIDSLLDKEFTKTYDGAIDSLLLWKHTWRMRIEKYRPFFNRMVFGDALNPFFKIINETTRAFIDDSIEKLKSTEEETV